MFPAFSKKFRSIPLEVFYESVSFHFTTMVRDSPMLSSEDAPRIYYELKPVHKCFSLEMAAY